MDMKSYEGKRWIIVYGKYEGVEKYAVDELYKLVQQYVPYILTISTHDAKPEDIRDYNIILIGTEESNRYIAQLKESNILTVNQNKQGYTIKVSESSFNPERQMIILAGKDGNGTLYSVRDFEHYYCDVYLHKQFRMSGICVPFIEEMPEYEAAGAPAVENRGLWTWGHVIYDYKRYLDNMSRWKMNIVTIWNDYVPLNAKDIVEYAHSRGIKVIWGYSWCWGEDVNPKDEKELEKWTKRILDTYEFQYADTGGDGIYFQTFTETSDTIMHGLSIADLVVKWVNHIAGKLLEKYPELWIQFGLHGTSVMNEYMKLADVDPRINITWEDAGSFPYSYDPKLTESFPKTLDFTSKICSLRGDDEDFGVVLKGMTTLDWTIFEHQKGRFILGEAKQFFIKERAKAKEKLWKYLQAYWIKNLKYVQDTVKAIVENNTGRVSIVALVEDGLWEERMWQPVAMYAELLWNPYEPSEEVIKKVALTSDSYFA